MLDLGKFDGPKPRCLVTATQLSKFLDHEQPPTKKRPFSTVLNQTSSHTLDLLLPKDAAKTLQESSSNGSGTWTYAKVHMSLLNIISGDFFNTYIKSPGSNILMLSQGESGSNDPIFSLSDGILRLELDKPTFEKTGLQGKSISTEGRKHVKARYAIELNLRLPNMVHGKSGFDRIVWAFKNVLNSTVTWLFCDLNAKAEADGLSGPIKEHAPVQRKADPQNEDIRGASMPAFPDEVREEDYADVAELLEWITLASQGSPRVQADDDIDAYLCRYQAPTAFGEATTKDITRLRWHGFIPGNFAYRMLLAALKAAGEHWVALTATAFSGEAYTILVHNGQSLTWEYKD